MKKLVFITFFILTFCAFVFGQNSNCPKVSVNGPSSAVQPGETMTFAANIDENEAELSQISYQWSVDKGTIIEGREEPVVSISTEGLLDTIITVIVEIKGLNDDCVRSFTKKGVVSGGGDPAILDEFGKISKNDEKVRLQLLVSELQKNAEINAYIIVYYPLKLGKKSSEKRVARIKNFLVKDNKIPAERIFVVPVGDVSEEITRIYTIPKGAEPPIP